MSDMWNSVARNWERNATFIDDHLVAATDALLDAVRLRPGADVLELACGPGGAGLAAAERAGLAGSVLLADAAAEMVAAAGRRAAGRPTVRTCQCDQDDIDAADATFDAVIVRHGLMFAEDHVATIREAARVLRPGGRYGAMTWGPRAANPWLGLIFDAVGEQFGVPFPPPHVRGPFALDDPAALAQVLEDAGLEEVSVQEVAVPMTTASLDAWWDLVPQIAGPVAAALAGMEPDDRDAIRERALRAGAAAAREAPGGIVMDGVAIVAAGAKSA